MKTSILTVFSRLYGHNVDWEYMDTRCPMWLSDFSVQYRDWPSDCDKEQKKFHQIRSQKKLKAIQDITEKDRWERVLELDKAIDIQVAKILSKTHSLY